MLDAERSAAYQGVMPARPLHVLLIAMAAGCASHGGLPPAHVHGLPATDEPLDRIVQMARDCRDRGEVRMAQHYLDTALLSEPTHVDALRQRQDLLRERGRAGLVMREAEAALAARPEDAVAHYLFGRLVGDRGRKLLAFRRAAELAPDLVWPWLGLAHTLLAIDPKQALAIYARLFAASDSHPLVAVAYAAALREADQFDAAAAIYRQLQGDARAVGVAELGSAQVALARGDRGRAWSSALAALRARPFDAGLQALLLGWIEAGANDEQVAQVLDVLREDPARVHEFARGDGRNTLALLLQRAGQLQQLRTLLEGVADARHPGLRRLQRRLLLGLGDIPAFLTTVREDVPADVVAAEPNRLRARWHALLHGPWHVGDPMASPAQAVALLAALRDVGWLAEAELVAAAALRRFPDGTAIEVVRDEVQRELAFEAGVRRLLYQGYQERDTADLTTVVERLRQLSLRVLRQDVVGAPERFSAPLVGEMLDPFVGSLAAHFDRYNKHFVLGRRAGGIAEGLLLTRLSLAELQPSEALALPSPCLEVVGIDRDVRSLGGVLGGDLAGVALLNHFIVDFDAVRDWAASVAERRRIAAEDGQALVADALPLEPGDLPFDAAWRLALLSPVQDSGLDAAVLDTIRQHERQHLVDSFRYLPVENNLWRSLGLVLSFGFSPSAIEAEMERRAELAALAVSPFTELVLAHIADFLGNTVAGSPHHAGFGQLGRELTRELRSLGVPAADAAPSGWHRVDRQVVQAAARQLLRQAH